MAAGNGIANLDPKKFIIIKGAAVHNLKKIDVALPRNNFIVITGVSGSGKSSLAFDTLYAEGQRRYVESLSSYARQFIGRMDKPKVDYINGIAPAIAIEQKVNTRNPRSTVGTSTEIYDYLKLLYARIGKTISPVSKKEVKKHTVSDVVDYVCKINPGNKVFIYSTFTQRAGRTIKDELNILLQKGFARIDYKGEILRIEDLLEKKITAFNKKMPAPKKGSANNEENYSQTIKDIFILIDRVAIVDELDDDTKSRIADSAQTAFNEGHGIC
ncbi:MAG: excinuclease ABC subunit A, partial [Bacteroidia bacterium]|nr:excinuclease ABC subunit A [Bacteroidia bacterium]